MLSKRNWAQKVTYAMIPFIRIVQNRKTHRDRKQMGGFQGLWASGKLGKGTGFLSGLMKIFWD